MRFTTPALLAAVTFAVTMTGCSVEAAREPQKSSQSKLLAPKALLRAKASPDTTNELGVMEWRVYRAKTDYVLSGHDANGNALAGAAIAFVKDGSTSVLRARALDGSYFASKHVFGAGAEANGTASPKTASFFHKAAVDMNRVRVAIAKKLAPAASGAVPTIPGADPFGTLGQSCGGDLSSMVMGALSCMQQAGGLNGANTQVLQQCVLASQGAAASAGTCAGTGTPGDIGGLGGLGDIQFDPFGAAGQDPLAQGQGPWCQDPFDMAGQAGGAGAGNDLDPSGGGMADGAGMDPYGMGDPFGGGNCMSCAGGMGGGGYDDLMMDPMNGGVCADEGGGGMAGGMGGYGAGW